MGFSTDGVLFFGLNLGEECPIDGDHAEIFFVVEEWNAKWAGMPQRPDEERYPDCHSQEWDRWRKLFRAWKENGNGVVLDSHCSDGCPMYYVAVQAKRIIASRGYPEEIPPSFWEVQEGQVGALRIFCQDHGIPWKEPQWWLASYMG